MRILLVEDEPTARLAVHGIVATAGHDVVGEATTGLDAIRLARERRPDVVLMDIGLPGDMNGIDTAKAIREQLAIRSLFVSALAGHARDSVDAARPFGFLLKPVAKEQLVRALDEIARQLGKTRPAQAP